MIYSAVEYIKKNFEKDFIEIMIIIFIITL